MALTDAQCRDAKENQYRITDSGGLFLLIRSPGKYRRVKYRIHNKEKLFSIGIYPQVSLAEAQLERDRIKSEIKTGSDPVVLKNERRLTSAYQGSLTFESVAREWHSKEVESSAPRYAQTIMHHLEKYTFTDLGKYPLHLLKPMVILTCLQKIDNTAPEMARRVKQLISNIFKYAIVTGRVENDYTYGLETSLKKYGKGHFESIDIDELPNLVAALYHHKARLYQQTYLAIRLMFLTFVRTSELINAEWSEIILKKPCG